MEAQECNKKENGELQAFKQKLSNILKSETEILQQKAKTVPSEFLDQAKIHLESAIKIASNESEDKEGLNKLTECLRLYSRYIFDCTFPEESYLVENDFPSTKEELLKEILNRLKGIYSICLEFANLVEKEDSKEEGDEKKIVNVLGKELAECLHWRIGALLFMYTHTLVHANRIKELSVSQVEESIRELELMLGVHSVNDEKIVYETMDGKTEELASLGIMSSTHLLTLMYLGEACYWRNKHFTPTAAEYQLKCSQHLNKYLHALTLLPPRHGWTSDRAQHILKDISSGN